MTKETLAWSAIITMDIYFIFSIIRSYGSIKFTKGRIAGFEEGVKLSKDCLEKIIAESEAKQDTNKSNATIKSTEAENIN